MSDWTHEVVIRKVSTGETRTHRFTEPWHDASLFMWQDGNMACDCNRALVFAKAGGKDLALDAVHCGDSEYEVVEFRFPNGSTLKGDA